MFFDSEIAANFWLVKTKSRYIILYGIAPELMIWSLDHFSLFCLIGYRCAFCNDKTGLAERKYFQSQFLRRPTAQNLFNSLYKSKSEREKSKLLQLAMDGPDVNWNVLDLFDDKLVSDNFSKILIIGNCAQHTADGLLENGLQKSTWNMDNLLKSIFWILHDFPARRYV